MDDNLSYCGDDESVSEGSNSGGSVSELQAGKIAREDIKLMNVVRAIVVLFLLTMAFITAETVYVIAIIAEQNTFRNSFDSAASDLISFFLEDINNKLWVSQTLSAQFTAGANTTAWPNVTIPDLQARTAAPLHLAQASSIMFTPFVTSSQRASWESYASTVASNVNESGLSPLAVPGKINGQGVAYFPTGRTVSEGIYRFQGRSAITENTSSPILFPIWQMSPAAGNETTGIIGTMFNQQSNAVREQSLDRMIVRAGGIISTFLYNDTNGTDFAFYSVPQSSISYPMFSSPTAADHTIVGAVNMEFGWEGVLSNPLLSSHPPLVVVVQNACGGQFSYKVTGPNTTYMGQGALYDKSVDGYSPMNSSYTEFAAVLNAHGGTPVNPESACNYMIKVYASQDFKAQYFTQYPNAYLGIVLLLFFAMIAVFILYDCLIEKRQKKVVTVAQRSDAIVRSLFPEAVRDRLYENAIKKEEQRALIEAPKHRLKTFLNASPADQATQEILNEDLPSVEPIADFFPNTTVLFADIAGFTAWSSEREPAQVFTLLETIYRAMDRAAKKFKVFKVETVGDCYVAATGIPEPQPDHAEIMVQFARTCLLRVTELTKSLEAQLGPGTGELAMRFGIHSGPVTAGVLRGQKARFQLFGDTMNTASRMETTGMKNKIHVSSETARLIIKRGHHNWVVPRSDFVFVKGKGECQTYWLNLGTSTASQASTNVSDESAVDDLGETSVSKWKRLEEIWSGTSLSGVLGVTEIDDKLERLINWNVEVLLSLLKRVAAMAKGRRRDSSRVHPSFEKKVASGEIVLDELRMVIELPDFDPSVVGEEVEIDRLVVQELRDYVSAIASGYPKNAFHNFEHASHVILSANKLLKRVVAPDEVGTAEALHDYTYGIGSDPLTQFAVVFSALVHDVGHTGVPNGRLSVEEPAIAAKYTYKSVAEQRSVDVAWDLLLLPHFSNLRQCIYTNKSECERFRAFLVNSVIATDIFDKELKKLRDDRWDLSFHNSIKESAFSKEDVNRKATIVIEHVIQASDVAHTMQHWHIYVKWNERLFREMYFAYLAGRSDKDPSEGWYQGELWFFDNYVIPLAKKLKECGVFGVSSDEYLNYAEQNRAEWERKGFDAVASMKQKAQQEAQLMGMSRMNAVEEHSDSSSASGVVKSRETESKDATTMSDSLSSKSAVQEEIMVPPGKLGIGIDTTQGTPLVHSVSQGSPLQGKLEPGDLIVEIDGIETRGMSATAIAALLSSQAEHPRRFLVERCDKLD